MGYAYREGELSPGVDRSDFITVGVTVDLPFTRGKSIDSALTAAMPPVAWMNFLRVKFAIVSIPPDYCWLAKKCSTASISSALSFLTCFFIFFGISRWPLWKSAMENSNRGSH